MMRYGLIAALLAVLGLSGALYTQMRANGRLTAENASLARSLSDMIKQRDQAREAKAVAQAHRAREREIILEHVRLKEALLRGGEDAELPDWFLQWLSDAGFSVRRRAAD